MLKKSGLCSQCICAANGIKPTTLSYILIASCLMEWHTLYQTMDLFHGFDIFK